MSAKFTKESFDLKWALSPTGCWEWLAVKNQDGYGRVKRFGKLESAHRVSYELYRGPLGDLHVCHKCDNPSCVNPDHLFLGTHLENQQDKASKGRSKGNRMPGISHPKHKLTNEQVLEIFYREGISHTKLAQEYAVSQSLVSGIKAKKRWKHLTSTL